MRKLIRLWRAHPILTSGFLIAAALTVFFIVRVIIFSLYWANPAHRDQAIEPWMTPGYVATSWRLPRDGMAAILGVELIPRQRITMAQIAAQTGISLEELTARIRAAARDGRGGQE